MPLGGNIYINDGGKIRKTTNDDAINQFKMAYGSPCLNVCAISTLPDLTGLNKEQKIFGPMAITLKYSDKYHVSMNPNTYKLSDDESDETIRASIELIKHFYGITGEKNVSVRSINVLSPLAYDKTPIDRLFVNLESKQPVMISPCAMPLLTAPASVAGMISQNNAEVLAGLVLCQLISPGNPFIYGNTSASTNMQYIQLAIGAPETVLVSYATAGLADMYKLPFRTGGGLSDAKDVDAQAGAETMMMIRATLDCEPDYVMHFIGCSGSFNLVSFEKYFVDEEIVMMATRMLEGIDCTEEKLCFDEIVKVGPRGTFLHGRTPKMYREEFVMAKLFNKDDPNNWQNSGAASIKEIAAEKCKERIASYTPPQRTKEQLSLIEKYLPEQYKIKL